jgi:transposase InsO family protein
LRFLTGQAALHSFKVFLLGVMVVKEKVLDNAREKALKRFSLIAPLLEEGLSVEELGQRRRVLLDRENLSERTLRRWLASYREKGFDGLMRQERTDKGQSKSIPEEVLAQAGQYRLELPSRSAGTICYMLKRDGHEVARSTLERHLRLKGLSGKQLAAEGKTGKTTRRYVRVGRNTLWQSDVKYGPYLPKPDNPKKKFRTYLLVIIDDATRMVVHGKFYADQKLPILENGLREAILRYGAPKNFYVDNGKIFTSTWLQLACARLNIRHFRTRPYSPEAKGKVERFNRTVESFLAELSLQKADSLEELNRMFSVWLSEGYNNKPHSALDGKTPSEVFNSDCAPLRFHSAEALADAFLHEAERTVDKTGCLSLDGHLYDAGAEWVRKKVTLRFDPFNLEEVQLWHEGAMNKIIREAQIGEYNAARQSIEEHAEETAESRVLKAYEKAQQERFKKSMGAYRMSSEED